MCSGFQITWIERLGEKEVAETRDVQDSDAMIALCKEWEIEDIPEDLLGAKGVCMCPVSDQTLQTLLGQIVWKMVKSFYKVELDWL